MSILLIDAGNSYIKWCYACDDFVCDDKGALRPERIKHEGAVSGIDAIEQVISSQIASDITRIEKLIMVSVLGDQVLTATQKACQQQSIELIAVDHELVGKYITTQYENPNLLGLDRLVAMLGARKLTQNNVIVVDCGTANTIDYLDKNNIHHGGVILPGIELMLDSLTKKSPALFSPDETEEVSVFARGTKQAIYSGVILSASAAINQIVLDIKRELTSKDSSVDEVDCIFTGGSTNHLLPYLKGSPYYRDDLIFIGLSQIIRDL